MARLKRLGYHSAPVEQFYMEFLRLPQPMPYVWHDRYTEYGEPLAHDRSAPITFTALYGLGLLEVNPAPVPPMFRVEPLAGGVRIVVDAPGTYAVRNGTGQLMTTFTGTEAVLPLPPSGAYVVEPL